MYNYWPQPIGKHPLYTSWFRDDVITRLARKDQATWNILALIDSALHKYPIGHGMPNYSNWHDIQKVYGAEFKRIYLALDRIFDSGVTLRHQVLNLPPTKFLDWLQSEGGWEAANFITVPVGNTPQHALAFEKWLEICEMHTQTACDQLARVEAQAQRVGWAE